MEKFEGQLKEAIGKGGAYIEIPFNVEETFGAKRVKVKATFDGVPYRGSIVRMGTECHIIGVTKDIRKMINKDVGDYVEVIVEKDNEERKINLPEDFKIRIEESKEIYDFWNSLSYSNQKKYVDYIDSAKKEETRKKRIEDSINKLINKEKL
ncbi:YdeI/OmpD-associated family protein [Clostridium sp.]|uniref:YdeI/OmpD-associated family protein n=1 Tax=Clostridium sp. TaxID=1506 RepID=UPI003217907F